MTVSTVQTVEGTVSRNYCVNLPSSASLLWKVETRVQNLFAHLFPFHFLSLLHQSFVCTNITHATFRYITHATFRSITHATFRIITHATFGNITHATFRNITHATFRNEEKKVKMVILGSNANFWPFCDFWTVSSLTIVPPCTIMMVPKFRDDGLTPSFTASTFRPYFDGPYRNTVIAQPWL